MNYTKISAIILVALTTAAAVILISNPFQRTVDSKKLDNGAEIKTVENILEGQESRQKIIEYSRNGRNYQFLFFPRMEETLEWIKRKTSENATLAAWWDYGHTIRGYTGRNVIAYTPSRWAWKNTMAEQKPYETRKMGEPSSRQLMKDLASIFVERPSKSSKIMEKYGADYLLIHRNDPVKYAAISQVYHRNKNEFNALFTMNCVKRQGKCGKFRQNGKNYLKYEKRGRTVEIFVPINDGEVQRGTIMRSAGGRKKIERCSRTEIGNKTEECIVFNPFGRMRLVFIPSEASDSTMANLLSSEKVKEFRQVYSGPEALIFKITEKR